MMEYDLKTYLPNDILTKVDRMSMRHSLEAREPLLDHRLIELAARIPSGLKIRNGIGKYILKKIIAPRLPPAVIAKRKQGFSIPLETMVAYDIAGKRARHATRRRETTASSILVRWTQSLMDFSVAMTGATIRCGALYAFERWYQSVHMRAV